MLEAFPVAITLIVGLDQEVCSAVFTSLATTCVAIVLASMAGVPLGKLVAEREFRGKRQVVTLMNTLMALPTVVIGLVLFGLLARQGLLGNLGLLFTPYAMIVGQTVLALPIVTNYTMVAVSGADPRIVTTMLTLGASRRQCFWLFMREIRFGLMAAVIAGFGRIIGEVGVAMMLGGNIRGYTRTMTTAIALETSKGEFSFGLALGLVLMVVALVANLFFNRLQQR